MRDAIDKHYADTGRYPDALDELVTKRYLRSVPQRPDHRRQRQLGRRRRRRRPLPGRVYDVKSGSAATALDGTAFNTW